MTQEDWERIRVQAAIAAMQGILSSPTRESLIQNDTLTYAAVYFADALIEELQKEK